MLEVGKTYRGCFEKKMMYTVVDVVLQKTANPRPTHYRLFHLTASVYPDARDEAGKTEWVRACDAENYLEELP